MEQNRIPQNESLFVSLEGLPSILMRSTIEILKSISTDPTSNLKFRVIHGDHGIQFPICVVEPKDTMTDLLYHTAMRRRQMTEILNHAFANEETIVFVDWIAHSYAFHYIATERDNNNTFLPRSIRADMHLFDLHDRYCDYLYPDISFFLDVDPEASLTYVKEIPNIVRQQKIGDIPELVDKIEPVLCDMYDGYKDFGKMCASTDTSRHRMPKTVWTPVQAERGKPPVPDQILNKMYAFFGVNRQTLFTGVPNES